MNITIVAVGKLKETFWKDACAEYLKRLSGYASVTVKEVADIDPAKAGGISASLEKEGKTILSSLPEHAHVILLAIKGKEKSSEAFAEHINDLSIHGKGNLAFVIGGSDGVSDEVISRADESISFGPVTLPHNLARVVLLEQIYRAFKINRGEPYHK